MRPAARVLVITAAESTIVLVILLTVLQLLDSFVPLTLEHTNLILELVHFGQDVRMGIWANAVPSVLRTLSRRWLVSRPEVLPQGHLANQGAQLGLVGRNLVRESL